MIDKNKSYMDVFGISGVAYEQVQDDGPNKLFNAFGLEVIVNKDGLTCTVVEKLPEGMTEEEALIKQPVPKTKEEGPLTFDDTKNSTLTIHERIRIADEKDPNYMTEEDIKSELRGRNVNFHKLMGRKKLSAILRHELGE
jgi:hypothetical protein